MLQRNNNGPKRHDTSFGPWYVFFFLFVHLLMFISRFETELDGLPIEDKEDMPSMLML
jgi:hypothetical protein